MFLTFIMPARHGRHVGEVHFSHTADTIDKLKADAVYPIKDSHKAVTVGEVSEEDANTLASMLLGNGWWVCWCEG